LVLIFTLSMWGMIGDHDPPGKGTFERPRICGCERRQPGR